MKQVKHNEWLREQLKDPGFSTAIRAVPDIHRLYAGNTSLLLLDSAIMFTLYPKAGPPAYSRLNRLGEFPVRFP